MSARAWAVVGIVVLLAAALLMQFAGSESGTGSGSGRPSLTKRTASLSPQDLALADLADTGPTSRLEGLVLDEHQQPVAGVEVCLIPGRRLTRSQTDGTFAFDKTTFDTYTLTARLGEQYAPPVTVRFSDVSEPATLHLRRGMTLIVHVTADGAPVDGAEVSVDDDQPTRTGSDGSARLTGLPPSYQRVAVHAAHFPRATASIQLPDDPGSVTEHTIALVPGAALGGTVVGPNGQPVEDATVQLVTSRNDLQTARAGASGTWHFDAMAAGTYQVTATSKVYGPAAPLEVKADGTTPRTDVIVHLALDAQLVGTVVDRDGQVVAGASVTATPDSGDHTFTEPTDAQGHFEILGVPKGMYRVVAHDGSDTSAMTESTLADNERTDIELVLEPSAIHGIVVDEKGEPVPGAGVLALATIATGGFGRARDTADSSGRFSLEGIQPGTYMVFATWPEAISRPLEGTLTAVTNTAELRIVLATPASVTGRVLFDDKPMPYFGVRATENPEFGWDRDSVSVRNADGRFTLRVEPGTWGVVLQGPGTTRKVIANVKLEDGKTTDLGDIVMTRGQRITGHVRDATGTAVSGAQVHIGRQALQYAANGPFATSFTALTDAGGAYVLDGVAADPRARIAATAAGHSTSASHPLPAGDATIDLVVVATGGIDGEVIGATNASIDARGSADGGDFHLSMAGPGGGFSFDDLPAGDYLVTMLATRAETAPPPVHVTVVANQRATVTLTVPTTTVEVTLHATGTPCSAVTLAWPGEGPPDFESRVETQPCRGDSTVSLRVAPGSYRACIRWTCVPVTVAPEPAQQTIEAAFPPTP